VKANPDVVDKFVDTLWNTKKQVRDVTFAFAQEERARTNPESYS
jgi:hypothetical protein